MGDGETEDVDVVYQDEERINEMVDRARDTLKPVWASVITLCKTLIWVSAGALVLSLTVTQVLFQHGTELTWSVLLPIAWVLFAITIILSLLRMATISQLRKVPFKFETKKTELRRFIYSKKDDNGRHQASLKKAGELWASVWDDAAPHATLHDVATWVSSVSLITGLVLLIAFAIINVPV